MSAMTVLAISGSLRAASFNRRLVEAAADLAPPNMTLETYQRLGEIPLYDADLDDTRPPEVVADLRSQIAAAHGLLIATPEYNHAMPGVLKNALDWASTPPQASVLAGKPTAVMGASPSPFGTIRAQLNLRQVLAGTGSVVVAKPEVAVFAAYERFDAAGRLADETSARLLSGLLEALAAEISRHELLASSV